MNKAKEISALWSQIKPQIGELVRLCHEVESHAEVTADAYQRGYENGFIAGHLKAEKSGQSFYEDGYQCGLNEAWECARKICLDNDDGGIPASVVNDIFNVRYYRYALRDFSATEVIEKIRQYEQRQEESKKSIKEQSVTVEEVMRQYLETFCVHAGSCVGCPLHTPDFTCGRGYHFITKPVSDEEVRRAYATVLQKMKEN